MAELKATVHAYFDNIPEIIEEIKALQTYKMFEGDEETYVLLDDVAEVLARHIETRAD